MSKESIRSGNRRIVHGLRKAWRGRAHYAWSAGDGSLLATWERES